MYNTEKLQLIIDRVPEFMKMHKFCRIQLSSNHIEGIKLVISYLKYFNSIDLYIQIDSNMFNDSKNSKAFIQILSNTNAQTFIINSSIVINLLDLPVETWCTYYHFCTYRGRKEFGDYKIYEYLLHMLNNFDELDISFECSTNFSKFQEFLRKHFDEDLTIFIELFKTYLNIYKEVDEDLDLDQLKEFNDRDFRLHEFRCSIGGRDRSKLLIFEFSISTKNYSFLKTINNIVNNLPLANSLFFFINFNKRHVISMEIEFLKQLHHHNHELIQYRIELWFSENLRKNDLVHSITTIFNNLENILKNLTKVRICTELFKNFI